MKLLSDAMIEIDYFEMLSAIQQHLNKYMDVVVVSWMAPSQDIDKGTVPHQSAYRVKVRCKSQLRYVETNWAVEVPLEKIPARPDDHDPGGHDG